MAKKNLKKTLLTCFGVVAAATPLVSVVSCGKQNEVDNRVGSQYDKEYGVNEAVYKKLKVDFTNQVLASLHTTDAKEKARKDLLKSFNQFDQFYNEQKVSYTALTNSMIEFASRVYNVRLQRQTVTKTAKWSDIDVEFQGMQKSFLDYMRKAGISQELQNKMLSDSAEQFNGNPAKCIKNFVASIKEKYDDPLMGLITAKSKLMSCFSTVNKDIALVAASIRLHEFFDNHEVSYDTTTDDSSLNKFDVMNQAGLLVKDSDFSSSIAQVFTIVNKQTGQKLTEFNPLKVCPGFVVKPILKNWMADPLTNTYTLKIDWTCVSDKYIETNDASDATAHYYNGSNETLLNDDIDSVHDFLKNMKNDAGIDYNVILSKTGEIQALKNAYFSQTNDEYLELDWNPDEKDLNAYDAFFFGERTDDGLDKNYRSYNANTKALAQSGLTVSSIKKNTNDRTSIRLDKLIEVKNDGESQVENNNNSLINDFVKHCDLRADAEIDMTKSDEATVTLYANYKNTSYDFENDEHKIVETKNPKGFTLSNYAYDFLTTKYNEYMEIVEVYTDNIFEEEYEVVKSEVIFESIMFSLSGLFAAQTTAFCFVPVFAGKLPIYIALLSLTWISMIGQSACLGLLVDKKWNKVKKYKESCGSIQHSDKIQTFASWIKNNVGDENFLNRVNEDNFIMKTDYDAGYSQFKQKAPTFLNDVLPQLDTLQRINEFEPCQEFMATVENISCSPKKYTDEMQIWSKYGSCTLASMGLMYSSLAVDLVCIGLLIFCPEMTDWNLVKMCRIMAAESGTSFKHFLRTYKILKQLKDFNKFLKLTKGAKAASEFTQGAKDILMTWFKKEGKNLVKYEILTDKFLAECPEAIEFITKNWTSKSSSLENFIKHFAKAEADGVAGFAGVCKAIFRVGLDGTGKAVEGFAGASKVWLKGFLEDMSRVLSSSTLKMDELILKSGQEVANALKPIKTLFNQFKPEAKDLMRQLLQEAIEGISYGSAEAAFSALKEIDKMLFKDTKNWIQYGTNFYWHYLEGNVGALKAMQEALSAPMHWLNFTLNRVVASLEGASEKMWSVINNLL